MGCPTQITLEDNLTFTVTTHAVAGGQADADSAPTYRVYEEETGTAILTGTMAKLDDANTLGFYSEQIAGTAANGFESGKSYSIYITATVSGTTGAISYGFTVIAALPTAAENRAEMDSNSTQLAAIVADTNELQTDDVPGLIAALNDFNPATDRVLLDKTDAMRIASAVNDASASNTAFVTDLTETTNDHYVGRTVIFTSGALLGQASTIAGYDGTTKTLTVTALTEAPADNDTFEIV